MGAIAEGVRPRAKRAKRDGSRLELLSFFVDECAKNLRIALVIRLKTSTFMHILICVCSDDAAQYSNGKTHSNK